MNFRLTVYSKKGNAIYPNFQYFVPISTNTYWQINSLANFVVCCLLSVVLLFILYNLIKNYSSSFLLASYSFSSLS